MYRITLTRQAEKDIRNLENSGLKQKAAVLLRIIRQNPFQNPPPYEKLRGFNETYSRRINIQHRLVYHVLPNDDGETDDAGIPCQGIIKIIRMWTHYE
ncbi:addiction module protein [Spirochaetia bacterium]|nr:addiction module protein [Spirochaetia bacterium]